MERRKERPISSFFHKVIKKLSFHLTQLSGSERGRRIDKFTQDFCGFFRWIGQSWRELGLLRKHPECRILAIYDLSSQPFSIGDILTIQEATLVLREEHRLGEVDFALLYNPDQPACPDPAFAGINSENVLFHLASVLPAAQVNPHLGSLFVFNSPVQLNRFIADNSDRYFVWPSAWRFSTRDYNYFHVFNDLLANYHQKHGALPRLACRPFLANWAHGFYEEHANSKVPITVQIRQNKSICTSRNLNIDCWLEFFRICEFEYPAKFIVICARSEIDDRFRDYSNVVVAKDFGTTIEQDLALIQTAAIHMGAASGPGMMAIFNQRPYLFVNSNAHIGGGRVNTHVPNGKFWKFTFATPYQNFAPPPESTELLVSEFARMWSAIDPAEWKRESEPVAAKTFVSWLR